MSVFSIPPAHVYSDALPRASVAVRVRTNTTCSSLCIAVSSSALDGYKCFARDLLVMTEAIEPSLNAVFGEEASFVPLLLSRVADAGCRIFCQCDASYTVTEYMVGVQTHLPTPAKRRKVAPPATMFTYASNSATAKRV